MLTTLQTAKTFLQIPSDDTSQDTVLDLLLDAATDSIESYCGRTFAQQSHNEKLNASRTDYLLLRNHPIVSVESVLEQGEPVTDYEILSERGVLFRKTGWNSGGISGCMNLYRTTEWKPDELTLEVNYTGGYITPEMDSQQTPRNLPKSLEMACILLAKHLLDGTMGIISERLGDHTVEYARTDVNAKSLPPAVIALISPYVRRVF